MSVKKGAKYYYFVLNTTNVFLNFKHKWEECMLTELKWAQIYVKPLKTTQDTKLRWFQFRILHNLIATKSFLIKIKQSSDDKCSFCNIEVETISHLFWHCSHVQKFWKSFSDMLR